MERARRRRTPANAPAPATPLGASGIVDGRGLLGAAEAAARLGVKLDTLYAYVSRGLIRRHRVPGERASAFDPAEIDRLAARGRSGRSEAREIRIESALTAIENGRYFYRG